MSGAWGVLKRTVKGFREDNLTDWAAALTYYGVLAIFPALLVLVSVLGLIGPSATQPLIDNISEVAPGPAKEIFTNAIQNIEHNQGAAGVFFVIGLLGAVWSASGYVGAFMRASNVIYETPEGRPFWKLRPLQVAVAFVMVILFALLAISLVLTGPVVSAVAAPLGIGSTAVDIWNIAKWPVMVLVFILLLSILYYASPNVKMRGFKWISAGSVVAVIVWIIASVLFGIYVANFSSYNETYGTLGGLIALMIWIWISNMAILFGHQLNSERERSLELEEGQERAEREIQLEPRSEPKAPKTA